jgi:GNAT superfamily N-acetyltransferase
MPISIRLLREHELATVDHIFRLAFGTFTNHPDPAKYGGDVTYIKRWYTDPTAAFGAEVDGQLVGSNFAINWGSFGLFGPLTVHPDCWGKGIAQQLIEAALERFNHWQIQHAGFFTFPNSPLHLNLYQRFGFYPRFLTTLLAKAVQPTQLIGQGICYSALTPDRQAECLAASRELTNTIFAGLDVSDEIQVVASQGLGDTIFLWDDQGLVGFAVCHYGKGTEAGSDTCYIKFGAVRSGARMTSYFEQLLQACETLSLAQGASRLVGGVSTARQEAYQQMLALGFRIERMGVAMHQSNQPAFSRPGVYVIDDWR